MQIGMIGLGRMGSNMVLRLLKGGHRCVVFDENRVSRDKLANEGAQSVDSLAEMVDALDAPRAIWIMLPEQVVDRILEELTPLVDRGDILIDGGNSYFPHDIRRASQLAEHGIAYVDVGTSGGVWGLERGYCLMIGGESEAVSRLQPIFESLAPAADSASRTTARSGRETTADRGYLHCGPHGAGHFVKMVHNGIEYGLMAAYSEGFAMLYKAGEQADNEAGIQLGVETGEIAELWRRGSVVGSWLLDLAAQSLARDSSLSEFSGQVADSGEGRWTVKTATDMGIPAQVLTAALYQRFSSRDEADYANRMLSALRFAFGGHTEKS